MTGGRRLEALRAKADEIVAGQPGWDGEAEALLVTFTDPATGDRIGHRFVPITGMPAARHLHVVREAS